MRSIILAAAAVLAVPAFAQMPVPGAADVSRVTAGTYKMDSDHTQVLFTLNHFGFSEYTGVFIQPTGSLVLDPAIPTKDKVEVTFAIEKMVTTTPALVEHLKKPEFFDAAQFPEGKFVSTKVVISGKTAMITGNLTLKGVTKPVVLAARLVGAGTNPMKKKATIGFSATTTIKRSDFGISAFVPVVSDEVKLTINAAFEAQ